MVPLLMQREYKPNGWLGLILGTNMYYCFFVAAVDTDEKFMQQMDALTREIGDRGKATTMAAARVSEGVPPRAAPTPTPEPAFSPSMSSSAPTVGGGASFAELTAFLREHREEAKAERASMEAKMEQQREGLEAKLQAHDAKIAELTAPAPVAISEDELMALQGRIGSLHVAKLLSDEELYSLEDLVADYVDLQASVAQVITEQMILSSTFATAGKLHRLARLSTSMTGDAAFARQAKRRFL